MPQLLAKHYLREGGRWETVWHIWRGMSTTLVADQLYSSALWEGTTPRGSLSHGGQYTCTYSHITVLAQEGHLWQGWRWCPQGSWGWSCAQPGAGLNVGSFKFSMYCDSVIAHGFCGLGSGRWFRHMGSTRARNNMLLAFCIIPCSRSASIDILSDLWLLSWVP